MRIRPTNLGRAQSRRGFARIRLADVFPQSTRSSAFSFIGRSALSAPSRTRKVPRAGKAQGICAFEAKRIGGFRSTQDKSGAFPGLSMKSVTILAPHELKCLTL